MNETNITWKKGSGGDGSRGNLFGMSVFVKKRVHFLLTVAALLLACHGTAAWAVAKTATAVGGGTWATATWSPAGVPGNGDTCTINSGVSLSVDTAAVCGSLALGNATATATTLTLIAGGSLNITTAGGQSGSLSLNPSNVNRAFTVAVGAQTLTVDGTPTCTASNTQTISVSTGQIAFTNAAGFTWTNCTLTVTGNNAGGSVNFAGLVSQTSDTIQNTGTAGTINFNGGYNKSGGTFTTLSGEAINFGGNFTVSGTALVLNAGSISTFTNTATITPTVAITFGDLTINPGGAKTVGLAAGTVNVAGDLTVSANSTFSVPGATLAVTGNTSVDGTISFNTSTTGTKTFTGAVSINNGGSWTNSANEAISLNGDLTVNTGGSFSSGTGLYTFNGAAAQTITNAVGATAFAGGLTLNNTNGLTLGGSNNVSVAGVLTFTLGNITTGSNTLIDSANCSTIVRTSGFVIGKIQAHIPAGASTCVFHVGTGANYTPVSVTFPAGTTAGDITGSTTASDHPQIASSGLDSTQTINRYWTLTNAGVVPGAGGYSATFTWVAGDQDAGLTTGTLKAANYTGASWNAASVTGNTALTLTIGSQTGFDDFAMGEITGYSGTLGRFNAYTVLAPGSTVQGFITTQVAGTAFNLTVIHMTGGVLSNLTDPTVTVALYDGSDSSGAFTNNCSSTWTAIAGASQTVNFNNVNNRTATFTIANSYPNVRVRINNTGSTQIGCSTDAFAIRPSDLVVTASDSDWQTAGATRALTNSALAGTVVHKAGQPFTVTVNPRNSSGVTTSNYAGNPTGTPSACSGSGGTACTAAPFGTLTIPSWSGAGSSRAVTAATYSEVGAFGLQLEDQTFAAVDALDGSTTAQRYVPLSTKIDVGRFVPDHFDVTVTNTPVLKTFNDTSCATRSFTYFGQAFQYLTSPVGLVTARNASGGVTTKYQNSWWRITAADVTQTYSPLPATLAYATVASPAVVDLFNGTGTVTADSGDKLTYVRGVAQSPLTANITLTMSVQDVTEVASASNSNCPPATSGTCPITSSATALFNGGGTGIAFDSGSEIRYGRLKIPNAYGSELLDLPLNLTAQYWNGTSYVTNTADNCTSIAAGNFSQVFGTGATMTTSITGGGTLSGGVGTIKLTKPTSYTAKGSRDVTSLITHLPGTARATFGLSKGGPVIYLREIH